MCPHPLNRGRIGHRPRTRRRHEGPLRIHISPIQCQTSQRRHAIRGKGVLARRADGCDFIGDDVGLVGPGGAVVGGVGEGVGEVEVEFADFAELTI